MPRMTIAAFRPSLTGRISIHTLPSVRSDVLVACSGVLDSPKLAVSLCLFNNMCVWLGSPCCHTLCVSWAPELSVLVPRELTHCVGDTQRMVQATDGGPSNTGVSEQDMQPGILYVHRLRWRVHLQLQQHFARREGAGYPQYRRQRLQLVCTVLCDACAALLLPFCALLFVLLVQLRCESQLAIDTVWRFGCVT